jgi:hypothetical protein
MVASRLSIVLVGLVALGCTAPSPGSIDTELPSAPVATTVADDAVAAAPAGCPTAERIGIVSDMARVFDEKGAFLVFASVTPDLDAEKLGLTKDATRRELTRDQVRALGVRASDDPVWVMADEKRQACRLTPRRRFVLIGPEPWEWRPLVVTQLEGTCDIKGIDGRLAVQQSTEPTECRLLRGNDGDPRLVRDPGAPAALRDAFGGQACKPPCDHRTDATGFTGPDGRRIEWSVAAHVHKKPGADECHWEHEDFMGLLVKDREGPVREVEAHGFDEVLVEGNAIVAFVDRSIDGFDLWAWPVGTEPKKVQTVQHHWAHEEDNEYLALSPYCGP